MRLNSRTGIEGSPVSSLNCDRSLHSGIRAPEVVTSADCRNWKVSAMYTTLGFRMHKGLLCNLAGMGRQTLGHISSCRRGVHLAYAWRNETAKAGHYKHTASMSLLHNSHCLWQSHHPFTEICIHWDYHTLGHTCMRPRHWPWTVLPASMSSHSKEKRKRKENLNRHFQQNSDICCHWCC